MRPNEAKDNDEKDKQAPLPSVAVWIKGLGNPALQVVKQVGHWGLSPLTGVSEGLSAKHNILLCKGFITHKHLTG